MNRMEEEAGTINEQYAVNFIIAEFYDIMEQYETEIDICQDLIRMDAERIN